jgi:hypothetical protein
VLFAGENREAMRRRYVEAWRRRREGLPLEPLDAAIADVIELHPEYQALLSDPGALEASYSVEAGRTNPFLHMGLHLALREQLATRRPAGIVDVHAGLARRMGDVHAAEHRMIEVLAETLWEAQRAGRMPDEARYLERLRQLV